MKILWGKKYVFYFGNEEYTSTAIYYGVLIGQWFMGMSWRVKNKDYKGHVPPKPIPRP